VAAFIGGCNSNDVVISDACITDKIGDSRKLEHFFINAGHSLKLRWKSYDESSSCGEESIAFVGIRYPIDGSVPYITKIAPGQTQVELNTENLISDISGDSFSGF
jgi:hypothetical protein